MPPSPQRCPIGQVWFRRTSARFQGEQPDSLPDILQLYNNGCLGKVRSRESDEANPVEATQRGGWVSGTQGFPEEAVIVIMMRPKWPSAGVIACAVMVTSDTPLPNNPAHRAT